MAPSSVLWKRNFGAKFCRLIDLVPCWHPADPLPLAPHSTCGKIQQVYFFVFLIYSLWITAKYIHYQIHQLYKKTASSSILSPVRLCQNALDLLLRVTKLPIKFWLGRSLSTHQNVLLGYAVGQLTMGFQLGTNVKASSVPIGTKKNMGCFEVYCKAFFALFSSRQRQKKLSQCYGNFPWTNLSPTYK